MDINKIDKNMNYNKNMSNDIIWYDPLNSDKFNLCGTIYSKKEKKYTRLSNENINNIKNVNKNISYLSLNTAGIQLKFKTDSNKIVIKADMFKFNYMSHMTAIGQSGFDLYYYNESLKKYVFHNSTKFDINTYNYEINLLETSFNKMTDYIINFPLYNGINSLLIGLCKNANVIPSYFKNEGKILLYGTSIAQGGCVSRPGMLYTNILSRNLDIEFLNMGFSGNAFNELEMAIELSKIKDLKLFIIDSEANAGINETLKNNLEKFLLTFYKSNPNVPVLLLSRTKFQMDLYDTYRINLNKIYDKFFKKIVKKFRKLKYKIYYLDGKKSFKDEKNFFEYTVDGIHPTDLGNFDMAKYHLKKIKKIMLK